ncbi:protein artichoke-like isoform X2 [Pseudomyrmex gracilis]|uniref:protein artichoke-like isoform X2 n=1 Tax=Pseudomyrmex gracilis TaxID=219809 RepID=UPI0009949FDE|nr:protein artichoke-like isoform X2 [Pseudomyrmex gracilis]
MTKHCPRPAAHRHAAENAIMMPHLLIVFLVLGVLPAFSSRQTQQWRPCVELKRDLLVHCKCAISASYSRSIEMNCDRVIFTRDTVDLLRGQPIVSISQRNCGHQTLPEDLINSGLNLRKLDLSGNSIYRLMDRVLQEQSELRELRLADNLLGDSLNPIFSSNEFHNMEELEVLDLSRNGLRSLEEGIFKGCTSLQELYLDGNNLTAVPTASLKGLRAIKLLSLAGNNIGTLPRGSFAILGESLLRLDLSDNELSHIDDGTFSGVQHLLFLNISHNSLARFNSDVFKGAFSLLQLDLSANFLQEFPTDALRHLIDLRFLNISNNLIVEIERTHLSSLTELQVLDLSRNNIGRLEVNTFSSLSALTRLDLSLNALRTIEESAFEGLTKLKWLSLRDNNILLVPASAFTRLSSLAYLHVEFNRIAALSVELIRATSTNLVSLSLTRNLVREIPPRLFNNFKNLISIELSGNLLSVILQNTFAGLEDTLLNLDVSCNRLTSVNELPLKNLLSLNLANNQLKQISPDTFKYLHRLQYLNLSGNPLYSGFPPVFPSSLINLDVSYTKLKILPTVLLLNLVSLEKISLAGNQLQEIDEGTFQHLYNLTAIDLSYNAIDRIANGAFVGLINLQSLNLRGNKLTSFVGEHFNTGTGLEILDLSENRISQLSPTAFVIHPRLRRLDLSGNQFVQFPSDFVKSLQFLEWLDLSRNTLRHVSEFAFSQINRLYSLNLSGNKIELVDDLAFHNSTQLQLLNLSENMLETLSERTMEGLLRLEFLDLRDNRLASLPETIFDPSRIRAVEKIDLSGNRFNEIPVRALQRQLSSLLTLKIARNRIVEMFTQDVVNNVKELDLSENSLSVNAIRGVLGEVKILRTLNLAGTGIKTIPRLETPFLKHLNISNNAIADIKPVTLERTTMLESLDVSSNHLTDLTNLISTFKILPVLQSLDVSNNKIKTVNESSFDGLNALRSLKMANLPNCTRIERNAFRSLKKLRSLHVYNYPKLGYFDVQGILKDMTNLETLDIEIKDSSVGNEQLSVQTHPHLRELTLRGERLRSVLSSSLVGVRGSELFLGLKNTSVDSIPTALFFPVPRSTRIELDISGSKFTNLPAQLLAALDERGGSVRLSGLINNPINCNCETKHLWRWLRLSGNKAPAVICANPDHLAGALLTNLTEETLSCTTSTKSQTMETTLSTTKSTTSEPQIIWTVAPTMQNNKNKHYNNDHTSIPSMSNISSTEDTLIIGIVGGVVAFIAIIVIAICICRLRWSSQMQEARLAAMTASSIHEASMIRPMSAYSGKINPHEAVYMGSYNGSTLGRGGNSIPPVTPVQIMPYVQPMHVMHAMGSSPPPSVQQIYGYHENSPLPMYARDNKLDR